MFYRGEKIEDSHVVLEAIKSMSDTPAPGPTPEERIAALEEELAAAKILLGLEE